MIPILNVLVRDSQEPLVEVVKPTDVDVRNFAPKLIENILY